MAMGSNWGWISMRRALHEARARKTRGRLRVERAVAAVDDPGLMRLIAGQGLPAPRSVQPVIGERHAGLDLDRLQPATDLEEQVDLMPVLSRQK